MYTVITDPNTKQKYNIDSIRGKFLLNKYTQQIGGKFLGFGNYKCAFSPAIKCFNEMKRIGDAPGDSVDNYVSLIVQYGEAMSEMKMNTLLAKFDPTRDFTIPIERMCPIGDLDQKNEEQLKEFITCKNSNFLGQYKYPYNKYPNDSVKRKIIAHPTRRTAWNQRDLFLLLVKKGGIDLHASNAAPINVLGPQIPLLCIKFVQVITGLLRMNQAGFTHADIKRQNVLYNEAEHKYYIIDFGQTAKSKTILHNSGLYTQNYFAWPKTVKVANKFSVENKSKKLKALTFVHGWSTATNTLYLKYGVSKAEKLKFIRESGQKLDVFSLGGLIKKFFLGTTGLFDKLRNFIVNDTWRKQDVALYVSISTFITELQAFVDGDFKIPYTSRKSMIAEDPYNRYSMAEVLTAYSALILPVITEYNKVYPSLTAATKTKPTTVATKTKPTTVATKTKPKTGASAAKAKVKVAVPKSSAKAKVKVAAPKSSSKAKAKATNVQVQASGCAQYKMAHDPKCKDQAGCVYKRGKGCISSAAAAAAKPKAKAKVVKHKAVKVKATGCAQYKMAHDPKCKDQAGCVYKRGKGCIPKV